MEKILYYVVEPELNDLNEWTGIDLITCYSISNDTLIKEFETTNQVDDTMEYLYTHEEVIQMYLDDNGMSDDNFKFLRI